MSNSPIAQTFSLPPDLTQGCIITSIDLFFDTFNAVAEQSPVQVQLVECLNGYPTQSLVSNSSFAFNDINLGGMGSSTIIQSTTVGSSTTLNPTNFKFHVPVFILPNKEYAIVVISNSLKYKVWTGVLGQGRVDSPAHLITQQPYVGSLFLSQNGSAWTAEQTQTLCFRLNRAKFSGSQGKVTLVEARPGNLTILPPHPFLLTTGSKLVRVHHVNHGLVSGMNITYSGATGTYGTQFNNTWVVGTVVDDDHYFIALATNAAATVFDGGNIVTVEATIKYNAIVMPAIHPLANGTTTTMYVNLANSSSIDSNVYTVSYGAITELNAEKYVYSGINRTSMLGGASSFQLNALISTANDAISPIIDLNDLPVGLLGNRINNPSSADVNAVTDVSYSFTGASNISFTAGTNTITAPTIAWSSLVQGAWLTITGTASNPLSGYIRSIDSVNNLIYMGGVTLVNESNTSATLTQFTSFISETANGGTAESKYITVPVTMTQSCTGFRVMVSMNIPAGTDIQLYYKAQPHTATPAIAQAGWTQVTPLNYAYSADHVTFNDYQFDVTNLSSFDQFQVKFVFLGSVQYVSPKISNLRVIAHA